MTHEDRLPVPDSLVNYPHLRLLATDRLNHPSNRPLSTREIVLVAQVILAEQRERGYPNDHATGMARIVDHLFGTHAMPRFGALEELLNPYNGYLATYPHYIARLARYLLDWEGATAREHALVDWPQLKAHYPHLF